MSLLGHAAPALFYAGVFVAHPALRFVCIFTGPTQYFVCILYVVSPVFCTGPAQNSNFVLNLPCFRCSLYLHYSSSHQMELDLFPAVSLRAILFFFCRCPFARCLPYPFFYLALPSVVNNFFHVFIVLSAPYRLFPSSRLSCSYRLFRLSEPLSSLVATASPSTSREGVENPQFATVRSCRLNL